MSGESLNRDRQSLDGEEVVSLVSSTELVDEDVGSLSVDRGFDVKDEFSCATCIPATP